jgi:endonuclease/exonuclease/phosphatase family metal-dependent hydrolase
VYVIYRADTWSAGAAGQWNINTSSAPRWGVYTVLTHRATGARMLFVSTHLSSGAGTSVDYMREAQTRRLISDATRTAARYGNLPIIYAGDYNSHELHHPDGPAVAMRAAGNRDAIHAATQLTNRRYNSANGERRRPPADGHSIDHIYVSRAVHVYAWRLWLDLYNGAFRGVIPSDHNLETADVDLPR